MEVPGGSTATGGSAYQPPGHAATDRQSLKNDGDISLRIHSRNTVNACTLPRRDGPDWAERWREGAASRRVLAATAAPARVWRRGLTKYATPMELNGTSAIVTGAAIGLGEATARALAQAGAYVVVA